MKLCLLDMDGVLTDFIQGCIDTHRLQGDVESLHVGNLGNFDFAKVIGMEPKAFWEPLDEEFWANLKWMVDGRLLLGVAESKFGRENCVIVTSPCSNRGCHDGKLRWMREHLPRHYSTSKGHMFGSLKHLMSNPDHVLIDDSDANIDKFSAYRGGLTCMVPRIWNRLHDRRHESIEYVVERLGKQCT